MEIKEFTKEFFQEAWGNDGYYEEFSYGVGINKVCEVALYPFFDKTKIALEIGTGGGAFTNRIVDAFQHLFAIDVIKQPKQFESFKRFTYIELPNQSYDCPGIANNEIDFCFCYNMFCHLSNDALKKYLKGVHRVLRPGGDFVFMLGNFHNSKEHFHNEAYKYKLGDITPIGHFYQDERTLTIIADEDQWRIESPNMIPEHRDIIVHLKKK